MRFIRKIIHFVSRTKGDPKSGSFAAELLEISLEEARKSELVKQFIVEAWENTKLQLIQSAKKHKRCARFDLIFEYSKARNEVYRRPVTEGLIKMAAKEGVTVRVHISWNDTVLVASW